jgi:hypothetical protein
MRGHGNGHDAIDTLDLVTPPAPASSWLVRVLRKRIIVHTLDDKSIEGVLMEVVEDGVILRAAKLLGATRPQDVAMAGETWVREANISFAQLDE